ncbi:MAG: hypothetical protein M3R48_09940 [Candidatus Dormibacteraeota bacterium]|nr:hypothetical protein [Candidatus Dormibacteraeota bacterium]
MSSRTHDPVADDLGHDGGDPDLTFAAQDLGRDRVAPDANRGSANTFVAMNAPPGAYTMAGVDGPVSAGHDPDEGPAPLPDLHNFLATGPSGEPHRAAAPIAGAFPDVPSRSPAPARTTPFHVAASPLAKTAFHVTSESPAIAPTSDPLPWMVRGESEDRLTEAGVVARYDDALTRTVTDTVRRLRSEAVDVSWTAAAIAVAADSRRRRRAR